jgi:hypothetical protein
MKALIGDLRSTKQTSSLSKHGRNAQSVRCFVMNHPTLFLVADALTPVRLMAVLALVAVIAAFVYVVRHLKKIEGTIKIDNLVPAQRGPRNNMVLIVCAVPIVVIALLLFLIFKT